MIIKDCYDSHFSRVVGSVHRLKGFKKVVGGHVFSELGSDSSLNKLGQVSKVGDWAVVFEGL